MSIRIMTEAGEQFYNKNVQFPVVEVMDGILPRDNHIRLKFADLAIKSHVANKDGVLVSVVEPRTEGSSTYIVEQGVGINRVLKDGQLKSVNPHFKNDKACQYDTQQFGYNRQLKWYHFFVCALRPDICQMYADNLSLEINHCIIPKKGVVESVPDIQFYEVVSTSRNANHRVFVERNELYGTPVSCFDFNELRTLWARFKVNEGIIGGTKYIGKNRILMHYMTVGSYRRLLTWCFFIKYHTNGGSSAWKLFLRWFNREFYYCMHGEDLASFKNYIIEALFQSI